MRYALRADLAWLIRHTTGDTLETRRCMNHDTPLVDETRPRSLWHYPMPGGMGRVVTVRHIFCPTCQPERLARNDEGAEPVLDIELIEVDSELRAETPFLRAMEEQARTTVAAHSANPR